MGISRKDALQKILEKVENIESHLWKMSRHPSATAYNHWKAETQNWINQVEVLARHVGKRTRTEVMIRVTQWKQAAGFSVDE